jgi:hypothetical protein
MAQMTQYLGGTSTKALSPKLGGREYEISKIRLKATINADWGTGGFAGRFSTIFGRIRRI